MKKKNHYIYITGLDLLKKQQLQNASLYLRQEL